MILKIQPANPGIIAAIRYNENKMSGNSDEKTGDKNLEDIEEGRVLATRNVPDGKNLADEIERLKEKAMKARHSGPKIENITFHMSVNPSDTDKPLSEEQAVQFIDEVMKGIGYGDQPYRIYQHTDIPRKHYHVVSTRVGQDGKKVNDSFERVKLRQQLKSLSSKYGFEVVLNEKEKEELEKETTNKKTRTTTKKEDATPSKKTFVPPFNRDLEKPITKQFKEITEDALTWHFSTFEQLQNIMMRRYNTLIEIENDNHDGRIKISGLGADSKPCTVIMDENDIAIGLMKKITAKIEKEKMHNRRDQKKRLETLLKAAAKAATSYQEFTKICEKKGVWIVLSKAEGTNEIFGATYIDRATRCAWKASETDVNIKWLKETAQKNGWTLEQDKKQEMLAKRNSMPSRRNNLKTKSDFSPIPQDDGAGRQKRIRGIKATRFNGSNADVTKNRDSILDDDKKDNKPIEYI